MSTIFAVLAGIFAPHTASAGTEMFSDAHRIPGWVQPAVEHLVEEGVLEGFPDGTFRANKTVTRAELAQALYLTLRRAQEKSGEDADKAENADTASRKMLDALRAEFEKELEIVRSISEENSQRIDDLETRVGENEQQAEENTSELQSLLDEVRWSGDLRLRTQFDQNGVGPDRERKRIRFRLNSGLAVSENFDVNFRLSTGRNPNATSGNQTLTGFNSGYDLNLDYANAEYHQGFGEGQFRVIGGSAPSQFMANSEIIFDSDVTFPGLVEQFELPAGNSTLRLTMMQNALSENGGRFNDDLWIFGNQLAVEDLATDGLNASVGYFVLPEGSDLAGTVPRSNLVFQQDFDGDGSVDTDDVVPGRVPGLDDYELLHAGTSYAFEAGSTPFKIYGDYLKNLGWDEPTGSGLTGVQQSFGEAEGRAWDLGFKVGKLASQGDFDGGLEYRDAGAFANFPFLGDSDFGSGNVRGVEASLGYLLRDDVELSWTGFFTRTRNLFRQSGDDIDGQRHFFDLKYSF